MIQKDLFESSEVIKCKPVLRWAGGKNWLIKHLQLEIKSLNYKNYHEPFFGGGSIFFSMIDSKKAFLSDSNAELINFYKVLKSSQKELLDKISSFPQNKNFYYKIRSESFDEKVMRAARFLYLNKTCFNGLYRVNSSGLFNVPYGNKKFDLNLLSNNCYKASQKLKKAELSKIDFQDALKKVNKGDLVFFDPPYTVTHNKNGFISYNEKIFSFSDQVKLANILDEVDRKGAFFILTNANHEVIKGLYSKKYKINSLSRRSLIGGKNAIRGTYSEILVKNF